jgi:hypothetical protein
MGGKSTNVITTYYLTNKKTTFMLFALISSTFDNSWSIQAVNYMIRNQICNPEKEKRNGKYLGLFFTS